MTQEHDDSRDWRSPAGPMFSILVPMEGDRGDLRDCLEQWGSQQYRRDRFEILLLTQRVCTELERSRLSIHCDRLLCEEGGNLSQVYDLGARAAGGQFLVFTESHCVPEPDFLEQLDLYLRSTSHVGACCRVIPVSDNALARMDELLCEEGCAVFRREGDWRKFNVQAVALARQAYLAVGGLAHRYDRFAEMLLAAALRDKGLSMGYAPGPTVAHRFRSGVLDVIKDIEAYVGGENDYRWDHPGEDRVGHSFLPSFPGEEEKADLLWLLCRTLAVAVILRGWLPGGKSVLRAFPRVAWKWLRGGRRARWFAFLSTWGAVLRCCLWQWRGPRLERAYRQIWKSASRWIRLRFLQQLPPRTQTPVSTQGRRSITEFDEADVLGLHPREMFRGEAFRWTGPAAVLRLPLGPHAQAVTLETRGVRQEPVRLNLAVFFRGRRLPNAAVHVEADAIRLQLPARTSAGEEPCLILTCAPIQPWQRGVPDRRELGIPLFAVHWQPGEFSATREPVADVA